VWGGGGGAEEHNPSTSQQPLCGKEGGEAESSLQSSVCTLTARDFLNDSTC
jgi:hypothetical protein